MLVTLVAFLISLRSLVRSRVDLRLENLALRHQICVLQRSVRKRPKLTSRDRLFWVWLSCIWRDWPSTLVIVKPETVVAWHRKGFRLFWSWISSRKCGRPEARPAIRALLLKMAVAHPLWGAPGIHGELLKRGIPISERTVLRLLPRKRRPPSQIWKAFLDNHLNELVSIDFFTVATATFRVLFVLVALRPKTQLRALPFPSNGHGVQVSVGSRIPSRLGPSGSTPLAARDGHS